MIRKLKRAVRDRLYHLFRSAVQAEIRALEGCAAYSPSLKVISVQLFTYYETLVRRGLPVPSIFDTGFRIFSQFDEDGILLFLFAVLGTKSKTFVDIGSGDGVIGSNCANLAINFGWHGLFIDGEQRRIDQGIEFYSRHPDTWAHSPKFVCAMVNGENVNTVIQGSGFGGKVDLLSIDIDGNDYWVWDALECIQPRVVIVETHVEFGYRDIVVPYDPNYVYPGLHPDYHGASPVAMVKLANRKGYRLVGSNRLGFNTIYIRNEEGADVVPTVSVEAILRHPRNAERFKLFEAIKEWEYVEGRI